MRRILTTGLAGLSFLALLIVARPAPALVVALPPPSVPQRVAFADAVVVGKVTSIEEKTVKAARFKGDKETGEYRVAVVKIEEALGGGNGLTHIKVAFLMPMVVPPQPGNDPRLPVRIRPIRPGLQQPPKLEKDQEALLFLKQHPTEAFYVLNQGTDVVDKKAANFAKEVAEAKKTGKLLADPMAGLKSKEAAERYQTAALLVLRYRSNTTGAPAKEEEIAAEESKLILQGLAAGGWEAPRVGRDPLAPQTIFYTLGIQPKDGWNPQGGDFRTQQLAMKKWLEDNAEKFRVKKFVPMQAEK